MRSALRLGPVTAEDRSAFDERLTEARRGHDLRAAAAAAAYAGPVYHDAYRRMLRHVRGGVPDGAAPPAPPDLRPTAVVAALTRRLAEVDLRDGFLFVEVGATDLTMWRADGGTGDPPIEWTQSWHEVCPGLSPYRHLQLFQLAGGVGEAPVDRRAWRSRVVAVVGRMPDVRGRPVVLVDAPAGLSLLRTAAAAVRERLEPVVTIPAQPDARALAALAQHVMSHIVRLEGYDALLGRYDEAGRVSMVRQPLLPPAQITDGQARRATLTVQGPPGGGNTVVPVVRDDGDPADAAAAVLVLPLREGERAEVAVRQDGPGLLELRHPAGHVDDRAWSGSADLARYGIGGQLDVVVTVELGEHAGAGVVRDRLAAAGRIVAQVGASGADARVAVIGYGDHDPARGWLRLFPQDFGPPLAAAAHLASLRAAPAASDYVAPLEEALRFAAGQRWRSGARKLLVVLAGRPPHPPQETPHLMRCPDGLSLPDVAGSLPADRQTVVVLSGPAVDPSTRSGQAARAWSETAWARLSGRTPLMSYPQVHDLLDELLTASAPISLRLAAIPAR